MVYLSYLNVDETEKFSKSLQIDKDIIFTDKNLNLISGKSVLWENMISPTKMEIEFFEKKIYKILRYLISRFELELNAYHNLQKDEIWWNTLLTPWIIEFLNFYLKREILINNLLSNKSISGVITHGDLDEEFIPQDCLEATHVFSSQQYSWNFVIDKYIFIFKKNIKISTTTNVREKSPINKIGNKKYKKIRIYLNYIFRKINNKNVFMHKLYIPRQAQLKLFIKKFIVNFDFFPPHLEINTKKMIDQNFRHRDLQEVSLSEEEFIFRLLIRFIPKSYLEDFKVYFEYQMKYWPKSCKFALTANSHLSSDCYKIYMAENRPKTKIFIFQHGSNYGTSEFNLTETFEIEISDAFFTWGWKHQNEKVKPLGVIKNIGIKQKKFNKKISLLLVEHVFSYEKEFVGFNSGNNYEKYKIMAEETVQAIDPDILSKSKIRSLNHFYHSNLSSGKHLTLPRSVFEGIKGINNFSFFQNTLLQESAYAKLNVCMTDSTPFLEILNIGYPVVGLWPSNFESYRESAQKDFHDLKEVGIIFNDHRNLAKFINQNFDEIEEWWQEVSTDLRVLSFREKYARSITSDIFNFHSQ
jgi:putative transferase (TIGR04331 family)